MHHHTNRFLKIILLSYVLCLTLASTAQAAFVSTTGNQQQFHFEPQSGFITTNEASLDTIFSQASFGNTPIDIRFDLSNPRTINNTDLLSIDSANEINTLFNLSDVGSPVISLFYVDTIAFCSGPAPTNSRFIGCASTPGRHIIVDAQDASPSSSFAAQLIAHEIGHNLGLLHIDGTNTNLMNDFIYTGSDVAPLTSDQVTTIFNSPLVQADNSDPNNINYFVEIVPFAVLASVAPVPEPSSYAMLSLGLILIGFQRIAKKKSSTQC